MHRKIGTKKIMMHELDCSRIIRQELPLFPRLHPSRLTEPARRALISCLHSLNQLADIAPENYGTHDTYNNLLDQLVATYLPTATSTGTTASATTSETLYWACEACWTKYVLFFDEQRDHLLDQTFEYLDTVITPAASTPVSYPVAALIRQLFSHCSLDEDTENPYLLALRTYLDAVLPHLGAVLLPLETNPSAVSGLTVADVDQFTLLLECDYLFEDAYRRQVRPLCDILHRHLPRHLSATPSASLLAAYSRLLHADVVSGRPNHNTPLAAVAQSGLETSSRLSDDWWQYLSVCAAVVLDHEYARQDLIFDTPSF